jgi:hypothetical protein
MDKVLGWFLVACTFAALSAALTIVLWHTRRRAVRAESLVDRLLTEREMPVQRERSPSAELLEVIAEEIDRLGEGQRFLTNALLERRPKSEASQHTFPRSVTPH